MKENSICGASRLAIRLMIVAGMVLMVACQTTGSQSKSSAASANVAASNVAKETPAAIIITAYDRQAQRVRWPGFEPRVVPVAVFDGARTFLFRHPSPPAGFKSVEGVDLVMVQDGRPSPFNRPGIVQFGGHPTVHGELGSQPEIAGEFSAALVADAFRIHLQSTHPDWNGYGQRSDIPEDKPSILYRRRLELRTLRNALNEPDDAKAKCWALAALFYRKERQAEIPESGEDFERGREALLGLPEWVEAQSAGDDQWRPNRSFANTDLDRRARATGKAYALLLERFVPDWQQQANTQTPPDLGDILWDAIPRPAPVCRFGQRAVEAEQRRAQEEIAAQLR